MQYLVESKAWSNMQYRCYNPKCKSYKYYGACGITVCQRWRDSFQAFVDDVGPKPSPEYSIHRVDNDGNYEPGNCKWATAKEQAFNNRKNQNARINKIWFTPPKIIPTVRPEFTRRELAAQERAIRNRERMTQNEKILRIFLNRR
jgi:hypothetical protein